MFKTSILSLRVYQNYLKGTASPYSVLLFLLFPAVTFSCLMLFQEEVAALLQESFPAGASYGNIYYLDLVALVASEILWVCFFLILTWSLAVFPSREKLGYIFSLGVKPQTDHLVMLILFVFFSSTLYVSFNTTEHFPVSSNEYAYLFQAEMLSRGKFWEPAHDLPGFFYHESIAQHDGIVVSRFPPGWPLFLSAAFETGIPPFIVNPLLGVLTLLVFYFFARSVYGEQVAVWSLLAVALSGYFVFNSASFFSHVLSLLVTLLLVCNLYMYDRKRKFVYGILAGFFLGMIGIIRYFNALLVFLPFMVYIFFRYRKEAILLLTAMAMGALPLFAFLLSYNYSITGDAFLPVHFWAYPDEQLGFVNGHSFVKGLEHVFRWIFLFFYWCSPGFLILYFVFLVRKAKSSEERFVHPEDYILLMLLVGHFFYYQSGGVQFGPRFLFEGFPFLVLLVMSKVLQLRQKWTMAMVLASMVYALVKFPAINNREEQIVDERQDLYDLVLEQKISNAVVIVSSSTSPVRPMDVRELTRNDPKFLGGVIYALELPGITDQLMEYYSDRSFYKYIRDTDEPQGELAKIR